MDVHKKRPESHSDVKFYNGSDKGIKTFANSVAAVNSTINVVNFDTGITSFTRLWLCIKCKSNGERIFVRLHCTFWIFFFHLVTYIHVTNTFLHYTSSQYHLNEGKWRTCSRFHFHLGSIVRDTFSKNQLC
jgi:hypothetical protein